MKRNSTFRFLYSAFILACALTVSDGAAGVLVKVPEGTVVEESALPAPPVFLRNLKETVPAYKARVKCVESEGMFMDTVSINFHDYGMVAVARWNEGFDEINAAVELGAKYIRTSKPEEARRHLAEIVARRTRPVKASEFRIRDPFVLADPATKTYFLYETTSPYLGKPYARGVSVRTSKDLVTWSPPRKVQEAPLDFHAKTQWAPEVYRYGEGYLMFASLAKHPEGERKIKLFGEDQGKPVSEWWHTNDRGVWVYRSASPLGPFLPVSDRQITPKDWLAIDGTLWVQDGKPYMVFCHEGVQTGNGEMCLAEMSPDFTRFVSDIKVLFRAKDVPGGSRVTDGPWMFRSEKSGRLFMTWSNFVSGSGYSVILTESPSGDVRGPWTNQHVIYGKNGGHGMLFKQFDGKLRFALHYPERRGFEHLRLLDATDTGDDLILTESD